MICVAAFFSLVTPSDKRHFAANFSFSGKGKIKVIKQKRNLSEKLQCSLLPFPFTNRFTFAFAFVPEPPTSFAIIQNKNIIATGGNITVVDGQVKHDIRVWHN
jgi:hypothetical protein